MMKICRGIAFGLVLVAGSLALAAGTPGDLDTTFGTGGLTTTDLGIDQAFVFGMAEQSDGKLVAVGVVRHATGPDPQDEINDWGVARYATDGSLDTTFGTSGTTSPLATDEHGVALDVALDASGRIVIAGYQQVAVTTTSTKGKKTTTTTSIEQRVALVRLTSTGSLDTTFGSGGVVLTDIPDGDWDTANSIAILSDGDILVAGEGTFTKTSGKGKDRQTSTSTAAVLIRYDADGTLDTAFGDGGMVIDDFSTGEDAVALHGLGIQSDGKIVIAGRFGYVRRYDADGSLDTGFADGGTYVPSTGDRYGALAIDGSDRILLAGYRDVSGESDGVVARLAADGSEDWDFVTGISGADDLTSVTVDAMGWIVAAGEVLTGTQVQDGYTVRVTSLGTGDTTYGTNGISAYTTPDDSGLEIVTSVLCDANGDVVLGGGIGTSGVEIRWLVGRYLGN